MARWNSIHHDRFMGVLALLFGGSLERGRFGPSTLGEVWVQKVTRGCRSVNPSKWKGLQPHLVIFSICVHYE